MTKYKQNRDLTPDQLAEAILALSPDEALFTSWPKTTVYRHAKRLRPDACWSVRDVGEETMLLWRLDPRRSPLTDVLIGMGTGETFFAEGFTRQQVLNLTNNQLSHLNRTHPGRRYSVLQKRTDPAPTVRRLA